MASEAHEYVCDWRLFVLFAERFSLCYKHKEAQGEVPFFRYVLLRCVGRFLCVSIG